MPWKTLYHTPYNYYELTNDYLFTQGQILFFGYVRYIVVSPCVVQLRGLVQGAFW